MQKPNLDCDLFLVIIITSLLRRDPRPHPAASFVLNQLFHLNLFCSFNTLLNFILMVATVSYQPFLLLLFIMPFNTAINFYRRRNEWVRPAEPTQAWVIYLAFSGGSAAVLPPRCLRSGCSHEVALIPRLLQAAPAAYLCICACACLLKLANRGLFCFVAFAQRKARLKKKKKKAQCYKSK